MQKIKLLHVVPSVSRGGAEEYALSMAAAAADAGWDVHVAFPLRDDTASLRSELSEIGACYHPLEIPGNARGRIHFMFHMIRSLVLFLKVKPTVVHFGLPFPDQCLGSLAACALLKIPSIVTFHLVTDEHSLGEIQLRLFRWVKGRNQEWISVSNNNRKLLSAIFNIKSDDITLIYNGPIFYDSFACNVQKEDIKSEIRQELGMRPSDKIITTIGRLSRQKGYSYIIPAIPHIIKKHPDVCFVWVGEGEQLDELKLQLKEFDINKHVYFLGYRNDIPKLLAASDIFLFPTLYEGSPIALVEAMHAGVPVVTSNASGIPEVVEDMVHGVLFRKADSCSLLMALDWALDHKDKLDEMSGNAEKRVMEFSRQQMTNKTLDIIMQTIKGERDSGGNSSPE